MTLAALPGTELVLEVDGEDAAAALPVLAAALEAPSADAMPPASAETAFRDKTRDPGQRLDHPPRHPRLPRRGHRPGPGAGHRGRPHPPAPSSRPPASRARCARLHGALAAAAATPPATPAATSPPASGPSTAPSSGPTPCCSRTRTSWPRGRAPDPDRAVRRRVRRQPRHPPTTSKALREGVGETRPPRRGASADLYDIEKRDPRAPARPPPRAAQALQASRSSSWPTT